MRSVLLFISLTFLTFNVNIAQPKDCDDCMSWSEDRKLTWADFKGRAKKASLNEALTDSGMSIELECDGTTSRAVVKCFFNPSKSWTKSNDSDYLLAHEQLHFDITELFVRKLRKQLLVFGNDCKKLNDHIEAYYNKNYREFVRYQDEYDRESKHSLDKEKQAYWEKKVAKELAELQPFASLASN